MTGVQTCALPISLVVLVVLVAIFTGRLGLFSKGLSETTTCAQICAARGIDAANCAKGTGVGGAEAPSAYPEKLTGARDGNGNQCFYRVT